MLGFKTTALEKEKIESANTMQLFSVRLQGLNFLFT
jgi:hypothetical protein